MVNRTFVIIPAAGSGTRTGSPLPKQFVELAGLPVIFHTIKAFEKALPEASIVVVLNPADIELWEELCDKHGIESPAVCAGGSQRRHSVENALRYINAGAAGEPCENDTVLVHDAARPFVTKELIKRVVETLENNSQPGNPIGVIPGIKLTDSIREMKSDTDSESVDRNNYRAVQTPQAFPLRAITEAYSEHPGTAFTDEASAMEASGHKIIMVEGSHENFKITYPSDLLLAEAMMKNKTGNQGL